jgi:hypothetical protein
MRWPLWLRSHRSFARFAFDLDARFMVLLRSAETVPPGAIFRDLAAPCYLAVGRGGGWDQG